VVWLSGGNDPVWGHFEFLWIQDRQKCCISLGV
jgi:hypothetical protein